MQAEVLLRQREGRWSAGAIPHVGYQGRPVEWITEKLGIPEHTIRWSLNPEYQACQCNTVVCNPQTRADRGSPAHIWDGDVDPTIKALELIFQGKSVSIGSGTTTGKTHTIAACGSLCWLACYPNSIVLSLAPKQEQLLVNMWKEIELLWPKFKGMFPSATLLAGKLRMMGDAPEGETSMREVWAATAFAAGVGADEEFAQRLKGFHNPRMLWIIEEMPGVDQAKIETVIKTATADFNPIVGMGQPAHQYDTLTNFGKRDWVTPLRMSSYDFPNVVCQREVIPGGRSYDSILRDIKDAAGNEEDPAVLSQVRGIAPAQSTRALVRREWLTAAVARLADPAFRQGPLALGVDVADSPIGDLSTIARWQGATCTEVEAFRQSDAGQVGRKIYQEITEHQINPRYVGIDSIGVGASTVNELKRLGVKIRPLSNKTLPLLDTEGYWQQTIKKDGKVLPGGPKVVEAERYANPRSQMYWRLREDLRLGRIAVCHDELMFEELCAMEYADNEETGGKIVIAPKDDLRVRLGRSPDRADALAYGNWVRPRDVARLATSAPPLESRRRDSGLEKFWVAQQKREQRAKRDWQRHVREALRLKKLMKKR